MMLRQQLQQLETADMISRTSDLPELEYLFRHSLVHEAAYTVLLQADRQRLHQVAAETLERLFPERREELAPALGRHFSLAGQHERALHYLTIAAEAAQRAYANGEAATLYSQALAAAWRQSDLQPKTLQRLYEGRGRALEHANQYEQALANYHEMEADGLRLGQPSLELSALMGQATIRATANPVTDAAEAQRLLERALSLARQLDDRATQARILWNFMLQNTLSGGDAAERTRLGEEALSLARQTGQRELAAFVLHDLWYGYGGIGRWAETRQALAEACRLWSELGNQVMLAASLARTALMLVFAGEYDQAIALASEAHAIGQATENAESRALSRFMVTWAHLEKGDVGRAFDSAEEAVALGEPIGNVTTETSGRADLGLFYALLGQPERGVELARTALVAAEETFPFIRPLVWTALARVYLRLERWDEVIAFLAQADGRPSMGFFMSSWSMPALAKAELALALGRPEAAVEAAEGLIQALRRTGLRHTLAEALTLKARGLRALRRLDEAAAALGEGQQVAAATGSEWRRWAILAEMATVEGERQRPEAAAALRRQAKAALQHVVDRIDRPALRASFVALPAVRALLDDDPSDSGRLSG